MKRMNLSLIFHLHQPVGNFDEIFEAALEKAYLPLLNMMRQFDDIPFGLHISGPLFEYFEHNSPQVFDIISELSENGNLELIGGGFYEPVLSVIPERDAYEQLEWMNDFLEDHFSQRPNGAWLPERIWEPQMPELLGQAGIKYTMVDDYHFKSVGIDDKELLGYYITEHAGIPLAIMPISEKLRYMIPFAKPEESIEYLRSLATYDGKRVLVFGDDGEKFGLWPDTHDWVWNQGWFENFMKQLRDNSEWLQVHKPSSIIENFDPLGRIYLPTGSYFEMGEWTLPTKMAIDYSKLVEGLRDSDKLKRLQPFIRGGFWRNFFTKYEESNWMHKRMLHVSKRLSKEVSNLAQENQEVAERALYSAQCNCAYWHGLFGGLYMPHLRNGIWENLLECESLLGNKESFTITKDVDCDGYDETLICGNDINLWIKPSSGGIISELSLTKNFVNLTDTLSRYHESYHEKEKEKATISSSDETQIIMRESIDDIQDSQYLFNFDETPRRFAHDHFLEKNLSIEQFQYLSYKELGDFINKEYKVIDSGENFIEMERKGFIRKTAPSPVDLRKKITLEDSQIIIDYSIRNIGDATEFFFGVEINLALQSADDPEKYFSFPHDNFQQVSPSSIHDIIDPGNYEYIDNIWDIRIKGNTEADRIWMFPIYTLSRSQEHFAKIYQGTSLVHLYNFQLETEQEKHLQLFFEIENTKTQEKPEEVKEPSLFD